MNEELMNKELVWYPNKNWNIINWAGFEMIDWFKFISPEKARLTLSNLENEFSSYENRHGCRLSDKAKEIIIARLSEIAGRTN